MKKTAIVLALIAGLGQGVANAAWGPELTSQGLLLGGSPASGSFNESWQFDLSTLSGVAALASSVQVSFNGFPGGAISALSLSISDFGGATIATAGGVSGPWSFSTPAPGLSIGTQVTSAVWGGLLAPGHYSATVSGIATPGGSYSLQLAAIPAVSETDEWAMLLAGIGALGVMIGRRNGAGIKFDR